LKELNSLTGNLYNLINDGDRHFEKVARVELPGTVEDGIRIAFSDNPDRELDALHVLSEGHIRCLGLSILLAKNIREGCPLVIFDDVVNAIDDDHRAGVRRVIFAQDYMGSKQVILTTHAEQFVKELEQHVSKSDYDKLVNKMSFHVDLQERLIRVKSNTQQNYLYRIENACVGAQWSEALYNSRCCLESLSHKLWRKLSSMNLRTEFAVVIRMPNGAPDLMSVVESMNSFLPKVNLAGAYEEISRILEYFVGLKTASNVIWQYLNKGTHEEEGRPEFDPAIVNEVLGKLLKLDALIKAL
jgi:energy-coupling factor transporter ATP-binding protein EcfA2